MCTRSNKTYHYCCWSRIAVRERAQGQMGSPWEVSVIKKYRSYCSWLHSSLCQKNPSLFFFQFFKFILWADFYEARCKFPWQLTTEETFSYQCAVNNLVVFNFLFPYFSNKIVCGRGVNFHGHWHQWQISEIEGKYSSWIFQC